MKRVLGTLRARSYNDDKKSFMRGFGVTGGQNCC